MQHEVNFPTRGTLKYLEVEIDTHQVRSEVREVKKSNQIVKKVLQISTRLWILFHYSLFKEVE